MENTVLTGPNGSVDDDVTVIDLQPFAEAVRLDLNAESGAEGIFSSLVVEAQRTLQLASLCGVDVILLLAQEIQKPLQIPLRIPGKGGNHF